MSAAACKAAKCLESLAAAAKTSSENLKRELSTNPGADLDRKAAFDNAVRDAIEEAGKAHKMIMDLKF